MIALNALLMGFEVDLAQNGDVGSLTTYIEWAAEGQWDGGPICIERCDMTWIFNLIFFTYSYSKCRAWGEGCIQATQSYVTILRIWKDPFHFENLKLILSWACLFCPLCPYLNLRQPVKSGWNTACNIVIWLYFLSNRFRANMTW